MPCDDNGHCGTGTEGSIATWMRDKVSDRQQGEVVPERLLGHFAPVGWQHINLTGDYLWDADAFSRRSSHNNPIDNPRERFSYNRQCE